MIVAGLCCTGGRKKQEKNEGGSEAQVWKAEVNPSVNSQE